VGLTVWGDFAASDDVQYADGESLDVQLLTQINTSQLKSAPTDSVAFDSRAIRPYPPGNLQIDGESYPVATWTASHTLTWAHRSRTQQTDGNLFDHFEGDIGPEPGTTYVVEGYGTLFDSVGDSSSPEVVQFLSVDVGSATSYAFDLDSGAFDSNFGLPPEESTEITLKVFSKRDGYRSLQAAETVLQYPGFTDSTG